MAMAVPIEYGENTTFPGSKLPEQLLAGGVVGLGQRAIAVPVPARCAAGPGHRKNESQDTTGDLRCCRAAHRDLLRVPPGRFCVPNCIEMMNRGAPHLHPP